MTADLDAFICGLGREHVEGFKPVEGAMFLAGLKKLGAPIVDATVSLPEEPGSEFAASDEEVAQTMLLLASHEFYAHQCYLTYAAVMRGAQREALAELFDEIGTSELEDARYALRKATVLLGTSAVQLPPCPATPPAEGPEEMLAQMLQVEARAISLLKTLRMQVGESPTKYTIEEMLSGEQKHHDIITQHLGEARAAKPAQTPQQKVAGLLHALKVKRANAPATAEQLVIAEQAAQGQEAAAEANFLREQLGATQQQLQQTAEQAALAQQQVEVQNQQLEATQQQADLASQQAAGAMDQATLASADAAAQAEGKMRLAVRVQQFRQGLMDMAAQDPVTEEGQMPEPGMPTAELPGQGQDPAAAGGDPNAQPASPESKQTKEQTAEADRANADAAKQTAQADASKAKDESKAGGSPAVSVKVSAEKIAVSQKWVYGKTRAALNSKKVQQRLGVRQSSPRDLTDKASRLRDDAPAFKPARETKHRAIADSLDDMAARKEERSHVRRGAAMGAAVAAPAGVGAGMGGGIAIGKSHERKHEKKSAFFAPHSGASLRGAVEGAANRLTQTPIARSALSAVPVPAGTMPARKAAILGVKRPALSKTTSGAISPAQGPNARAVPTTSGIYTAPGAGAPGNVSTREALPNMHRGNIGRQERLAEMATGEAHLAQRAEAARASMAAPTPVSAKARPTMGIDPMALSRHMAKNAPAAAVHAGLQHRMPVVANANTLAHLESMSFDKLQAMKLAVSSRWVAKKLTHKGWGDAKAIETILGDAGTHEGKASRTRAAKSLIKDRRRDAKKDKILNGALVASTAGLGSALAVRAHQKRKSAEKTASFTKRVAKDIAEGMHIKDVADKAGTAAKSITATSDSARKILDAVHKHGKPAAIGAGTLAAGGLVHAGVKDSQNERRLRALEAHAAHH